MNSFAVRLLAGARLCAAGVSPARGEPHAETFAIVGADNGWHAFVQRFATDSHRGIYDSRERRAEACR